MLLMYLAVCTGISVIHYLFISKLEFDILFAKGYFTGFLTNIIPTAIAAFLIILFFRNSNKTSISISISIVKALVFACIFLAIDLPIINFFFGKYYLFNYVVNDIPNAIKNGFILELFWLIQIRKCV